MTQAGSKEGVEENIDPALAALLPPPPLAPPRVAGPWRPGHSLGRDHGVQATEVANDIGLVITISTPNLGTGWANDGAAALSALCTPDTLYGKPPGPAPGSFCAPWSALYAMQRYSHEIAILPWLPSRIPVFALGGDVTRTLPLFLTTVTTNTDSDLAVSDHSAIQGVAHADEGGGAVWRWPRHWAACCPVPGLAMAHRKVPAIR